MHGGSGNDCFKKPRRCCACHVLGFLLGCRIARCVRDDRNVCPIGSHLDDILCGYNAFRARDAFCDYDVFRGHSVFRGRGVFWGYDITGVLGRSRDGQTW